MPILKQSVARLLLRRFYTLKQRGWLILLRVLGANRCKSARGGSLVKILKELLLNLGFAKNL